MAVAKSRASVILRARILSGIFVALALLLAVRLYFVQIVHGEEYQRSAMGQYVEENSSTDNRDTIYFTNKDGEQVSGAVMQNGWTIAMQPANLTDEDAAYAAINAITPISKDEFMSDAARKKDPYEEVAQHLNDDIAQKIRTLQVPGIILARDQWRFYPGGTLAANVLGFIGYGPDGTSKIGQYGLEKQYQSTLSEASGGLYVNPFAEIFTNVQSIVSSDPAKTHGSIVTTIEPDVQKQLEKTLDDVMRQYTPKLAGGIIMDPKTGEIVAMAQRPSFNPNTYNLAANASVYGNALVAGRYELGSIMKPLTLAAGIDSGAITKNTTYNDTGCLEVSGKKVCNFDFKARGVIPMQQILSQSLNVGSAWVTDRTGYPTFTKYVQAYGLGTRTGIDLPNEVTGDLSNLAQGAGPAVNFDTAAFGQGIAISPIAMIRALSILANGGKLPSPHIVTGIKYGNGVTRSIPIDDSPQIIQKSTADTLTDMLTEVFDKSLLHGELRLDHYSIAAKTGTAQIPQPGGGYIPGNVFLHSFFGYFPAHNPRFIIFLFAVEPHGQEYASATLAHPFMDIAQYMINYYSIPPDR